MRTYLFEGQLTALTSITHNGGQSHGINQKLRREKFVQPDGSVADVPVLSGNGVRGVLRDRGMLHMCQALGYGVNEEAGTVNGMPLAAFYFLFSGGALTESGKGLDIDAAREIRRLIPLVGVFGGALGGRILPGKLQVGKAVPICRETAHLLPDKFRAAAGKASVWDYCQEEFYTRKDDAKNEHYRPLLGNTPPAAVLPGTVVARADAAPQQMMYYVETLAAGTPFYWRITLEDVTDMEFEAFLTALLVWSRRPVVGGKSGVGLGQVVVNFDRWLQIDSRVAVEGSEITAPIGTLYNDHLRARGAEMREFLARIK